MAGAGLDPRQFTWLPDRRTALTVVSQGVAAAAPAGSRCSTSRAATMANRLVEVEYGDEVAEVRLVPLRRRPGRAGDRRRRSRSSPCERPVLHAYARACAATSARSTTSSRRPRVTRSRAAALQYVRKVSGTTKPSQANEAAFDEAVAEIAHLTQHLLDDLVTTAPPKDREVEADKARARAQLRYGT